MTNKLSACKLLDAVALSLQNVLRWLSIFIFERQSDQRRPTLICGCSAKGDSVRRIANLNVLCIEDLVPLKKDVCSPTNGIKPRRERQ